MVNEFIVFSDLHLHNWPYGAVGSAGINSRLAYQQESMMEMETYALDHGIKHFAFCGDFFHTHQTIHAGPLRVAHTMMERWKRNGFEGIFLVGNHDMGDGIGYLHSLDFLKSYGHTVVDWKDYWQGNNYWGHEFHCLPYIPHDEESEDMIFNFFGDISNGGIVLLHQGVKNVSVNSKGFVIRDETFDSTLIPNHVFHVFTGHYHSHKHVTNKLTIVGSPMQHTWADSGEERGFLHVTVNPKTIRHIPLRRSPTFNRVDMCGTAKWGELGKYEFVNKFLRVKNFSDDANLDELRNTAYNHGALSVEFEIPTIETKKVSVDSNWDLHSLVEDFIEANSMDKKFADVGRALMVNDYQ